MKRVVVYCASSPRIPEVYLEATRSLAGHLVGAGLEIIFGGGATGLMGTLADAALERGGKVLGVMPNFMKEVEWDHKGVQNFHFTDTMHERKQRFLDLADGIITLPGGCGTWEELLEALTLKRLGILKAPIVILNTNGYYQPLLDLMHRSVEEGFMEPQHSRLWTVADTPAEVLPALGLGR
jgi:uncharacterized protein (TIGR00730 family)